MKFGVNAFQGIGGTIMKISAKAGMKLRKASPELMLVGGLIAGGAAIVTACMAMKKTVEENDIQKTHAELDHIQEQEEKTVAENHENGTDEILDEKGLRHLMNRRKFRVYKRLVKRLAKKWGLPLFLAILAVALILGSHGVLKKRFVSTTIAYKALDEAFRDYRERIKEAVGEEKELHYFNGTHEGGETTIIDENGKTTTTKDIVKDKWKKYSPYEFDFNAKTAPGNWEANSDYNLMFLRSTENYLNDLLNARGHVFMNEALDSLGMQRTPEGAVCGWVKGSGGDDYVDLGFTEYYTDEYSDAMQEGYMKNIHLNFNVDGVIWDKI